MKLALTLLAVVPVALLAVLLAAAPAPIQDGHDHDGEMPAPVRPGEAHKQIERKTGKWNTVMTLAGMPGEHKAVYTARMDLGGLWLLGDHRGEFMGGPFSGLELLGYDSEKGKYVSTWIDSSSDKIIFAQGDYDADTQTLVLWSEGQSYETGEPVLERHDTRFIDANHWEFSINQPQADGSYAAGMSIAYTRAR